MEQRNFGSHWTYEQGIQPGNLDGEPASRGHQNSNQDSYMGLTDFRALVPSSKILFELACSQERLDSFLRTKQTNSVDGSDRTKCNNLEIGKQESKDHIALILTLEKELLDDFPLVKHLFTHNHPRFFFFDILRYNAWYHACFLRTGYSLDSGDHKRIGISSQWHYGCRHCHCDPHVLVYVIFVTLMPYHDCDSVQCSVHRCTCRSRQQG